MILDQLLSPIPIDKNGRQMTMIAPGTYGRVTMTCQGCALVLSLNARTVGIV